MMKTTASLDRFGNQRRTVVLGQCPRDSQPITNHDRGGDGLCQICYSEDQLCYRSELAELERKLGI